MRLRICIPVIGNREWLGGISYVENLIKSLQLLPPEERPHTYLFMNDAALESLDLHLHFLDLFDELVYTGTFGDAITEAIGRPVISISGVDELYELIDFFFQPPDTILGLRCSAGWIPDFQHRYLPQFFHPDDLLVRDHCFGYKAEHARMMVFSSHSAENDFKKLYPFSKATTRILSFHTFPQKAWLQGNPEAVQQKHGIPDEFLICCNQFWQHKNHSVLFNALALLKAQGIVIRLVCTGTTNDYRCPGYFDQIKQLLAQLEISDQVYILGNIARFDQIQLIRRAMALVQPSLFEGWSTVIEDARALGKTQLISDLAVHREQSPDYSVYFDPMDPADLAAQIARLYPILKPGPNRIHENLAQHNALRLVAEFGRTFCNITRETCGLFSNES